mmetsp:Transcript_46333/g.79913  ORF Transcript_46333/g.79913 Transcript_46333/m.79913 type:complete len:1029 (-) Transcript_46333:99-3185(-)
MGDDQNVKVAVRVRPFNSREISRNAKSCIEMIPGMGRVVISSTGNSKRSDGSPRPRDSKTFTFDYAFDSFVPAADPNHASQATVWDALGVSVLESAWEGYNVSLFAYGQTGSGKSHSIVGFGEAKGIVPIACEQIFQRIEETSSDDLTYKVETSMMEIYNEKIRDLLVDFNLQKTAPLKLRDSPKTGAYVEGLRKSPVSSYEQIQELMNRGTRNRTVAATQMNETSSRAHTIFIITVTQTRVDRERGKATDKVSCINLIDLAGSERQASTGAQGDRLKEGAAINVSLSALGNVISALAKNSEAGNKKVLVPYRNSVLTHLLKNSLGGNARTTMIAAISPADINYEETLSTLRYANRAKQIKNKAVINEDPNEKMISQLRAEVEELRRRLAEANLNGTGGRVHNVGDMDKLMEEEREQMRKALEKEMGERLADMERMAAEASSFEQRQAETEALMNAKENEADTRLAFISNLNEDPALSGVLKYTLDQEVIRLGTKGADPRPDIILGGLGMQKDHAVITKFRVMNSDVDQLAIKVSNPNARVLVNGKAVQANCEQELHHNDRLAFGTNIIFKVSVPAERTDQEDDTLIDYEFAMKEINNDLLSAMTQNNEEAERLAKEKAEMLAKMKALEDQLEAEKKNAESAVGAAKDGMLAKQAELEERLQKQMLENEKLSQRQERELMERSLLDEALLKLLPLVHEANLISQELNKGMTFAIKLISKAVRVSALTGEEEMKTEIVVMVTHAEADKSQSIWNHEKFTNRIYIMREMYQQWSENNGLLQGTDFQEEDRDPFFDPPEDQNIGVARFQLEAVRYLLDIDEASQLIDYKGSNQGELLVQIVPVDDGDEDVADLEDISEMMGRSLKLSIVLRAARGLPQNVVQKYKSAFVKFDFFLTDTPFSTPHFPLSTINPSIDHTITVDQVVTPEFIEYVSSAALTLELWASVDDTSNHSRETERNSNTDFDSLEEMDSQSKIADLVAEIERLKRENTSLKTELKAAYQQVETLSTFATPRTRMKINDAQKIDSAYNHP